MFHPAHRLVPADVRIDREQITFPDADRRAMLVVHRVAVRDDGVEPVVAAEPLEDDEDSAGLSGCSLTARLAQEVRDWADATEQAESDATGAEPHHVATRHAGVSQSIFRGHRRPPFRAQAYRRVSPGSNWRPPMCRPALALEECRMRGFLASGSVEKRQRLSFARPSRMRLANSTLTSEFPPSPPPPALPLTTTSGTSLKPLAASAFEISIPA